MVSFWGHSAGYHCFGLPGNLWLSEQPHKQIYHDISVENSENIRQSVRLAETGQTLAGLLQLFVFALAHANIFSRQ